MYCINTPFRERTRTVIIGNVSASSCTSQNKSDRCSGLSLDHVPHTTPAGRVSCSERHVQCRTVQLHLHKPNGRTQERTKTNEQ